VGVAERLGGDRRRDRDIATHGERRSLADDRRRRFGATPSDIETCVRFVAETRPISHDPFNGPVAVKPTYINSLYGIRTHYLFPRRVNTGILATLLQDGKRSRHHERRLTQGTERHLGERSLGTRTRTRRRRGRRRGVARIRFLNTGEVTDTVSSPKRERSVSASIAGVRPTPSLISFLNMSYGRSHTRVSRDRNGDGVTGAQRVLLEFGDRDLLAAGGVVRAAGRHGRSPSAGPEGALRRPPTGCW